MSNASTEAFLRRLADEHDEGLHDEPETVNRYCAACAREHFADGEPDDPDHEETRDRWGRVIDHDNPRPRPGEGATEWTGRMLGERRDV